MSQIDKESNHAESCYCGKCIKRRHKKSNFSNFPYSKDIESTYNQYFKHNEPDRSLPPIYLKSMHSSLELGFKQHLSSGLFSTQKFDYKPFKIEPHESKPEKLKEKVPFFGSSSYSMAYVDWKTSPVDKAKKIEYIDTNVPLRGNSNYKESYVSDPNFTKFVAGRPIDCIDLGITKLQTIPVYKEDYKAADLKTIKPYLAKKFDKNELEKSFLSKNAKKSMIYKSSYSYDFVRHNDNKNKCLYD